MKIRSMVALVCSLALVLSLVAGCGGGGAVQEMSPREILAKSISAQNEVVSSKFAFDLSFDVSELDIKDAEGEQMAAALGSAKLAFSGEADSKRPFTYLLAQVDVTVEGEQHKFDAKLYSDGSKLLLNIPYVYQFLPDASLQKEYYIFDSALLEQANQGMQAPVNPQMLLGSAAMKELSVYTAQAYLDVLPDESIVDMGEQEIDVNGGKVKTRGITLKITKADVLAFLQKTVELYDDATWNELNFAYMSSLDPALTQDSYNTQMAQQKTEAQKALDEATTSLTDDTSFQVDTYIDSDFNMTAIKGTVSVSGADETATGKIKVIFNGTMWDFNKVSDMQLPETTPENSLNLSDMM
jgi:hypothetical protein